MSWPKEAQEEDARLYGDDEFMTLDDTVSADPTVFGDFTTGAGVSQTITDASAQHANGDWVGGQGWAGVPMAGPPALSGFLPSGPLSPGDMLQNPTIQQLLSGILAGNFSTFPVPTATTPNAAAAPGFALAPFLPATTPVFTANPRLAKDAVPKEQDELLLSLRKAGWTFPEISKKMKQDLGVDVSHNALVKRFRRIQDAYLEPHRRALENVMPEIMAVIKRQLAQMGLGGLVEAGGKGLEEELSRLLSKHIQVLLEQQRQL